MAAYERYVLVTALIPTPGSLRRFIGDGVAPSPIETEQLPPDTLATGTTATDLPSSHDGVAFTGSADRVDFNYPGISPVSDRKTLPSAQSLTSNVPPHKDRPDSVSGLGNTPSDGGTNA